MVIQYLIGKLLDMVKMGKESLVDAALLASHIGSFIYMASAKRLQTKRTRFLAIDYEF